MQLEKDGDSLLIKPNIIQLNSNGQTKQVKLINGILEISGGIIDISYNNDPDSHFTVLNTGQVGVGVDNIGDDKLKINGNVMINTPDEFTRYPLTVNGYRNVDSLQAARQSSLYRSRRRKYCTRQHVIGTIKSICAC